MSNNCLGVFLQGVYAVVEFDKRESVSSLLDEAAIPSTNHEALVPFKSRLLSLKNIGALSTSANQKPDQQCHPQTVIPINQLIQRLSREQSVSVKPYESQTDKLIQIFSSTSKGTYNEKKKTFLSRLK